MRFGHDDVVRFAAWSGDRNPLHVDADFARHTHFGQPIVHGILTVLGALQGAKDVAPGGPVRSLELEFRRAVIEGDEYALDRSDTRDGFAVTLRGGSDLVLAIRAQTTAADNLAHEADLSWARAIASGGARFTTAMRATPAVRSIDELRRGVEITGEYPASPPDTRWTGAGVISAAQTRVLALCSYITGMELPGLRSLFTRVHVEFHRADAAERPLWYRARTRRCDADFRLLETELQVVTPDGSLVATALLGSYTPFSPSVTDLDELARRLTPSTARLQGKVALVLGGSRGLGADIASALALAGAHVYATARRHEPSIERLGRAIAEHGGELELLYGDASDAGWCQGALDALTAKHAHIDVMVLNACAPPEVLRVGPECRGRQHDYIQDNLRLVQAPLAFFASALNRSLGSVIYVSSSAVVQPPPGWSHYVAVKQAGEALVRTVAQEQSQLCALIARPPALQTSWSDTPSRVAGSIPADWAAAHIVNRLADTWQAGHVELLSEFPPFAAHEPAAGPTDQRKAAFTVRVAGSFTTDALLPGLRFWLRELDIDGHVELAPYGQVLQSLLDPNSLFASRAKGLNVIFLRLRDWLRELPGEQAGALEFVRTYLHDAASEFERAVRSHRGRAAADTLLVLSPSYGGASSAQNIILRQTEQDLLAALVNVPGLTVVTASDYHAHYAVNEDEISDELRDEIAHIPYRDSYLHVLATVVGRQLYRRMAPPRKVVVVDCDNTLWRGVVGEVGPEGLEFDAGHRALHEALVRLSARGVLVCVCSKNDEADVWRVFDTRGDFALGREHVAAAMVNWLPKSQNLRALASRLNLGIDSFVFIDDNPVECAEVRASCPEVLTLQWPQQPERAIALLRQAWELEATAGTQEDQRRTQMYRDELQRQTLRTGALTFDDFIKSLQLVVDVEPLTDENVRRAAQLTLRTNQFNFTTKRRDESELQALVAGGRHDVRTVRVRDRFGDYGLVGLVIIERGSDVWDLDTFLLSCRVLGRGVEQRIVAEVGHMAVAACVRSVRLRVDVTSRNTPARMFFESIVAPELRTGGEQALEGELPAERLAAVKFEPTAEAEAAVPAEDDAPVAAPQAAGAERARRREAQIDRAAVELSTVTALQAAVEGRAAATPAPPPAPGDMADVVYSAFANALHVPVDTIKEVDRLEALGCDSLRIVEITVALRETFPWLPGTLLFEHRTVGHILEEIHALAAVNAGAAADSRSTPAAVAPRSPAVSTDVAVVGMHVTCAGANSPGELWDLLASGRSGVQRVSPDRKYFLGRLNDTRPHWAGLLDNPARFDPGFFGVSPREAEYMDPQLRLFLEVAWSAIEDAGCAGADHDPDTGVFVGVMYGDYGWRANRREADSPYRCWEGFSLANRLSQLLDFHGPSLAVDTACSSSGTALHLACRALTAGDCRVAIVGGVNLILDPDRFASLGRLGILSATGKCEPFGAAADGTVLGEGAGVVVLRPLEEAQRRGDRIYGVIKGTGLSTGNGTVGFTAPNPQAQANAIRRGLAAAGVDPRTIAYIETHGTGTALGDPIEVRGLTLAYTSAALEDPALQVEHRCRIGSIKPNVGHLEAGAGVVGLIKVLLQLHHRTLVPSITSQAPNPQIPFSQTPFEVQRALEPWEPLTIAVGGRQVTVPRRAGLSSFGVGGANAHVIVEEAPAAGDTGLGSSIDRSAHLLALSARSEESLRRRVATLREHLDRAPGVAPADLAYSLNVGHRHFDHRVAVTARSREELIARLESFSRDGKARGVTRGELSPSTPPPAIAFLFTGQGSQHAGMGRQLYDTQPVFRAALDRCASIFDALLGRPLLELLCAADGTPEAELLDQTGFTQPALFAFEYALAELWQSWGIRPDLVLGHSVGEIAAMCVAGGVSLEDGLTLVAARGRLMQALPPGGAMTSVMATENLVLEAIAGCDEVAIAAINAPRQVVISGAGTAVAEITARLAADGIKTKALTVSHAFHSPLMRPMLAEYEGVVRTIRFTPPRIPFVSGVDGALVSDEVTRPEYWLRQVMDPVRFAAGMRALGAQGVGAYIEIGPQPVLLGMGRQCLGEETAVEWLPSLKADADAWQTLLGSLSTLYAKGAPVDWKGFDAPYQRRRVSAPAYAFGGRDYWLSGLDAQERAAPSARSDPGRAPELYELQWQTQESLPDVPDRARSLDWVIVADRGGVGDKLAALLRDMGVEPVIVKNDEDPSWEHMLAAPARGVRIVHFRGLDANAADTVEAVEEGAQRALESVLHLVRTVSNGSRVPSPQSPVPTLSLWCVTQSAVAVEGDEGALALAQTPLWGFGRTIALEHPEIWGGLIDLPRDASAELCRVISEVAASGAEDQVVLRSRQRYVARLAPRRGESGPPLSLGSGATYLVTGGLGALGLHAARWLVQKGARRLVLTSRRGAADPRADEIRRSLKARGAAVQIVAADVARAEDVDALLAAVAAGPAPLGGIVHAAGLDKVVPLRDLDSADLQSVLRPKLAGGWLLHDRTRRVPLDFFVLFSSVASVLGSQGRAHYGAANAFLDALATERHRLGMPALSVNWGPWHGGGMASGADLEAFERIGNHGLDPEAALDALDALVTGRAVQGVVADIDWRMFRPVYEARRVRPILATIEEPDQARGSPRPAPAGGWLASLTGVPPSERGRELATLLQAEVAETLGFENAASVPLGANFYDIGMDSLMMAELVGRLNRRLGISCSAFVFDHPTVESLAPRLLDLLSAAPDAGEAAIPQRRASREGLGGYAVEDEDEVIAFQGHVFPDRRGPLLASRWRWAFVDSARRLGVEPRVWVFRDKGVIVGQMASIPVKVKIGGGHRTMGWLVDTMVLPTHRDSAVGTRIMAQAHEDQPLSLSLGQTEEARQICRHLGWIQIAPLQTAVLPVNPERVLQGKVPAPAAWAAGAGLRATAAVRDLFKARSDLRVQEVNRFESRHDALWERAAGDLMCGTVRDSSYLNWKYVDRPGQSFLRLDLLAGDRLLGAAVWMFREPDGIYKYRRGFLVDVVAPSAVLREVIHAASVAVTERADALVCLHIGGALSNALRACGYHAREPKRFLLADPSGLTEGERQLLLDERSWFVTHGDSDIDRP